MNAANSPIRAVSVTTYGRLHLGFFDLSGQVQRRFGSVGVAIDAYQTALTISRQSQQSDIDPWAVNILQQHLKSVAADNQDDQLDLNIHQAIPRHSGLGSGTQMALAIGTGVNTLLNQPIYSANIAAIHHRGGRSGIGIATFDHGGLVVDGGRGPETIVPPLLARHAFPAEWHFLLIVDQSRDGLHGNGEKTAFKALPPQTPAATKDIQHQLLMQGLPALAERDFQAFSAFVGALQRYNADYFAPAQGGPYASQSVANILNGFKQQGFHGVGQTSWGPTGFVLLPSKEEAMQIQAALLQRYATDPHLSFIVTAAINNPARIEAKI
ncbi:MAG TPA: beta-ribofuranosylaminobenzene 5'-phosphate synthase family protein [Methylophilus sp.]|uniref:beta-ribofuranosylaminobenzene 5'-phosphate synthase family protein n=1 Tax=Methylophilus sp. TaxID=29541 RepID=UPI002C6C4C36|nr:beta-ribofuranosylaminobenzene 5'-phosphate synthase family protein [Methylophilus sp.]HSH88016.1 beta-ribofuranosylaminobenzene 5'-phosphate synthase family protein [Methylophilus sp.]